MTTARQLQLFHENLPAKTRCCDDFDVDNKVRDLEFAITKRYIQPNNFNSRQWLVYDIDRPVCPDSIRNDNLAPEPTLFVSNPTNRHAHLFYLLKTPVHQNTESSQRALRFAAAVDCGLAMKLDADMTYGGLLAKNALHEHWEVLHTVPVAYELDELAESVDTTLFQLSASKMPEYGLHRNYTVFETLRKWSYKAIRQGYPDFEQWHKATYTRALALNFSMHKRGIEPLDTKEIAHIAKSVAKWTHSKLSKNGFSEWQSAQGKKGGLAKGKSYAEKRVQAELFSGAGMMRKDIAKLLGISVKTITNWKKGK